MARGVWRCSPRAWAHLCRSYKITVLFTSYLYADKITFRANSMEWLLSELGSQALIFNDDEVVELLRAAVEREGNQVAFAKRHGIDRVYLNMVLNRKRPVGESIIKSLGLCVVYVAK